MRVSGCEAKPTEKVPPQQKPKAVAAKVARKPSGDTAATPERKHVAVPTAGDLLDDVRALKRCVERGWMGVDVAWETLCDLVTQARR